MEFFGRAYFPHYFSRPSPEFHRELDAIWQQGVLKGQLSTDGSGHQDDQPSAGGAPGSGGPPWPR